MFSESLTIPDRKVQAHTKFCDLGDNAEKTDRGQIFDVFISPAEEFMQFLDHFLKVFADKVIITRTPL